MNNNPFESNNKQDDFASAHNRPAGNNNMNAQSSSGAKVVLAIIFGLALISVAIFVLFSIDFDTEDEIGDYVYDYRDLNLYGVDDDFDPFPKELPQGAEFEIASDGEYFIETTDKTEAKFIVGVDIEPGIYTLKRTGDSAWFDLDLAFDYFSVNGDQDFHNIPLHEGDIIEISNYEGKYDFVYTLVPQTEYVEYQDGVDGIFVYGLTYFTTKVRFENDYDTGVYHSVRACNNNSTSYCDYASPKLKHKSEPGSYFMISSEQF